MNLEGGQFRAKSIAYPNVVNNGSTIHFTANLDDLDVAARTFQNTIGTMTVTGEFTQEDGTLVFDVASLDSYDKLVATNGIELNGGNVYLEYEGTEPLALGSTLDIFGGSTVSFGDLFDTLVTNQAGTLFWRLGANGATVTYDPKLPEPASWLLMLLGSFLLARMRKGK